MGTDGMAEHSVGMSEERLVDLWAQYSQTDIDYLTRVDVTNLITEVQRGRAALDDPARFPHPGEGMEWVRRPIDSVDTEGQPNPPEALDAKRLAEIVVEQLDEAVIYNAKGIDANTKRLNDHDDQFKFIDQFMAKEHAAWNRLSAVERGQTEAKQRLTDVHRYILDDIESLRSWQHDIDDRVTHKRRSLLEAMRQRRAGYPTAEQDPIVPQDNLPPHAHLNTPRLDRIEERMDSVEGSRATIEVAIDALNLAHTKRLDAIEERQVDHSKSIDALSLRLSHTIANWREWGHGMENRMAAQERADGVKAAVAKILKPTIKASEALKRFGVTPPPDSGDPAVLASMDVEALDSIKESGGATGQGARTRKGEAMRDAIKKDPLTFAFATFAEATVALAEDLEPFREEIEEWVKEERDAEEIADAAWGKRQDQIDDGDEP